MEAFTNITLLPNPEISTSALMNSLFGKLHIALVKIENRHIGVSFPKHGKTLGEQLRLHGPKSELETLLCAPWLRNLRDYCQLGSVADTPQGAQFRRVKRVQAKSVHNKRKRSIAKGWLSATEAEENIPQKAQRTLNLPFAQLKSHSTGQHIRIFIEHQALQNDPVPGQFNTYGLSANATIPWF